MQLNIYNEDCLPAMKKIQDNEFDLAIVDPPYGINITKQSGWETFKKSNKKNWDNNVPNLIYFNQLIRVSKNQIIWGGNYFIDNLKNTNCCLIWDKMNGTNDMSDFELAWTSFDSPNRKFSMHHFSKGYYKKIHITQKPIKLYKWLLKNYTKQGDKILDTHLGSGSIAIACLDYKLELTAFEIDKEYYEAAMKRINLYKTRTKGFFNERTIN